MEFFVQWISKIVLFLLLAMVADMVLPSGLMKKYARLVMSILLLLIFLGPIFQVIQLDPEQLMNAAERTLDQQVSETQLQESIETKKNEILAAQAAYKLEQVDQALEGKLAGPLLKEHGVQLSELDLVFKGDTYEFDALDKLVLTISKQEQKGDVEEITISFSEQPEPVNKDDTAPIEKWVAEYLGMEQSQIEIRWEEDHE